MTDARDTYRSFKSIQTRWMDDDVYGHVNNVVYYAFFDTVVNAFLIERGVLEPRTSEVIGLVVETSCRYHASISFPDVIDAGVRVTKLGNSSVRYEVGIFRAGEDTASATGHFVHVYVDRVTRRPTRVPDAMRAVLAEILVDTTP